MRFLSSTSGLAVMCVFLCASTQAMAADAAPAPFSDLTPKSPVATAAEYLRSKGILQGYSDGTFRPTQKVLRAEALKMLVQTVLTADKLPPVQQSSFDDIKPSDWYAPYVEAALKEFHMINGPPTATSFHGANPIRQAEFLKMLLLSQKIDLKSYDDIQLPLSSDVTDVSAWYFPIERYALSASMTIVRSDGTLGPSDELTRGDAALLLYRLAMYQASKRTQALLSEEESELINVLQMIDQKSVEQAEYAAARALVVARGAYASRPTSTVTQGALKTAEAFVALTAGFAAGSNGQLDQSIAFAKDAWTKAQRANEISADLRSLTTQVQAAAKTMADQARALQTQK